MQHTHKIYLLRHSILQLRLLLPSLSTLLVTLFLQCRGQALQLLPSQLVAGGLAYRYMHPLYTDTTLARERGHTPSPAQTPAARLRSVP